MWKSKPRLSGTSYPRIFVYRNTVYESEGIRQRKRRTGSLTSIALVGRPRSFARSRFERPTASFPARRVRPSAIPSDEGVWRAVSGESSTVSRLGYVFRVIRCPETTAEFDDCQYASHGCRPLGPYSRRFPLDRHRISPPGSALRPVTTTGVEIPRSDTTNVWISKPEQFAEW